MSLFTGELLVTQAVKSAFIAAIFFQWWVMQKLEKYVGRMVSLKSQLFKQMVAKPRIKNQGYSPENFFLVAAVDRGINKLICYGANLRITVAISDCEIV